MFFFKENRHFPKRFDVVSQPLDDCFCRRSVDDAKERRPWIYPHAGGFLYGNAATSYSLTRNFRNVSAIGEKSADIEAEGRSIIAIGMVLTIFFHSCHW